MTKEQLNEWLAIRKFPKARLAYRLGVNRRTVVRWCSGATPLPIDLETRLPPIPSRPPGRKYVAKVWVPELGAYRRRVVRDAR